MAKCSRCDARKARRRCPALGSDICALCCGRIRGKDIHCPAGCEYLARHAPYREKKVLERRETPASGSAPRKREPALDDRMKWMLFSVEATLKEIADRNAAFNDKNALLACEYAKDKLAKGERRLILPGETLRPGNAAGEAVYLTVSRCRFERTALIAGMAEPYSLEDRTAAIDFLIRTIKALARDRWEGRTFLDRLSEMFDRKAGPGGGPKLITPA